MKYFPFMFLLLTSYILHAQEPGIKDSVQNLNEVIVIYQAEKTTPVTFLNINSKDIKLKSTGQEPSVILSELPSITAYSDAGNFQGYSYFRMRGIDQTRINMTLDGVPLNEPEDQGAYFSNYPDIFNSVSKLQIQRGVGTTKNGTASFAGSIQLFSPNLKEGRKTTFGLDYGSFNSMRAFAEYNSGILRRKAFYIRLSQVSSDGYKYNSSNNSQSVFISNGLFLEKSTLKLNILAGHQQNQLAWLGVSDSLISIDKRTNINENEKDDFTQCLIQAQHKWHYNTTSSIQSSLYYTFLTGYYDFNLNSYLGLPSTEELYKYAFQSNLAGFFTNYNYSRKNLNLIAGIHGNIYDRSHIGNEKSFGELYQNTGYKKEWSTFIKADYNFRWFSLFMDIQHRNSRFDYKGPTSFNGLYWNFFNPKAGISSIICPQTIVYYSIGKVGREPTRNDIFGGNDNLQADSLGNPLISVHTPEYVINHELGLRKQLPGFNLDFNFYYLDFENEIVLDGKFGPNGLALTNKVEQSYRTGIEISVMLKINKHFTLINNSSFNYSRIKEQKETFSPILTPPVIINQEAVYSSKKLMVALSARFQDKSYIDFANTSHIKGYFLLNAKVFYTIKMLQAGIYMNNITNSTYFNNGYVDYDGTKKYFVQAPVNFNFSIKYSF